MRIAEVSATYDISADTLRYYERIGLLPHIPRTASGIREYSEANCSRIAFIKCMRQANVSIEALHQYLTLLDQGPETLPERKRILEEQRDLIKQRVAEMQEGLDRLTYKIENYESIMAKADQAIRDVEPEQL